MFFKKELRAGSSFGRRAVLIIATALIIGSLASLIVIQASAAKAEQPTDVVTYGKTEKIPFETVEEFSDSLYEGESEVKQKGKNGTLVTLYQVENTGEDCGVKRVLAQTVTKEPQTEIRVVGTKAKQSVPGSKEKIGFSKVISVTATAYSPSCDGGQVTYLGVKPYRGIVAVDPRVIPLGTKMYIASPDGSYVYGYCVAGDTGGAIKGNRVDLFMDSASECNAFGRRAMNVYVLN